MLALTVVHCRIAYRHQRGCHLFIRYPHSRSASSPHKQFLGLTGMAPKRKAEKAEGDRTPEKKPRAKSAKKEKPLAEPHTGDDGWTIVPPSLLFKSVRHAELHPSHCLQQATRWSWPTQTRRPSVLQQNRSIRLGKLYAVSVTADTS